MAKILKIENDQIRSTLDPNTNKIFYSIVDSVGIASNSQNPRNYWKVLKNRLKKTHNQLVTECNQLKMRSSDGKFYLTDSAQAETIIKIIEIINPDYLTNFWHYFDNNNKNLSKESLLSPSTEKTMEIQKISEELSYPQLDFTKIKKSENYTPDFELLIDAYLTNNFIYIKAFTAGVNKDLLRIVATPSKITIDGSRKEDHGGAESEYTLRELSWGNFTRTIDLPQTIKEKEISITEENGLVIIKAPLLSHNQNKKIIRMRTI